MADHIKTGWTGEKIAVQYLLSKGYDILETNWRYRHKEIDIIAHDGCDIVFVEVKTRNRSIKKARECVGYDKIDNIILAANNYVRQKNISLNVRFDIIAIDIFDNNTYSIEHIESAFYARYKTRRS